MLKIVPTGPGRTDLSEVLQDYRRCHGLAEDVILNSLLEALSGGRTQALIALEDGPAPGRPMGAVILSRKGGQGRIHLLHARLDTPQVTATLLERAEAELSCEEGLECISATLIIRPGGATEAAFSQSGYRTLARARMFSDLASVGEVVLPPGYCLEPWPDPLLEETVALIEATHRGTEELKMYPETAGIEGARYLIEQVVGGHYGTFDPALSSIVLSGTKLAGLCLAVWHTALPGQGFIFDLCVDPIHRRRGLGRALVVTTARAFSEAGASGLGLVVTLANRPALSLYQELGFRIEQYFGVFQKGNCSGQ